jgi:hypothetical protein
MTKNNTLQADGFHVTDFNSTRPFSSFLPGIAGTSGKPLWVFYTNRGQCISSFGVRDKNGAMLEFYPANKAYALTSLLGFRTFIQIKDAGNTLYEPFQISPSAGCTQRLIVRPQEIEIEETHQALGLRVRVVYFTLPQESLPALVRSVTVENMGTAPLQAHVLDGLPQIVPFGLQDSPLKSMSRTMEAFAEIRHVTEHLPFFKLKVEPSDKPEVKWIEGGFFTFTMHQGQSVPVVVDPDLVFGTDTSFRTPLAFLAQADINSYQSRRETLTGSAFAQMALTLAPGQSSSWDSYFGQVPAWEVARTFRERVAASPGYAAGRRVANAQLIQRISERFALLAGPPALDPYTQQAFLDNTLRGGQPVVVSGASGARVFHTFTRKHGDMERDYNFFELAPSYWSQGNGNFRDVNQNRRSENFTYADVGTSNIETFFDLIQLDGNNPLVIQSEKFCLSAPSIQQLASQWHLAQTDKWQAKLGTPFSPGQLMESLVKAYGTPEISQPWFELIIGLADKVQDATHGEGYWVDHWIYNLDLLDSYVALYPDQTATLLFGQRRYTFYDNDHVVKPRAKKYVLRTDGSIRQLHCVHKDVEKAELIARRTEQPRLMRDKHGVGTIYRSTLFEKLMCLLAVKATLFDPFGAGLEMEAEKPGWCDALNGLPGLFGSSTHEAYALQRAVSFVRKGLETQNSSQPIELPTEVAELIQSVTRILLAADTHDFFATWDQLASAREAFRHATRLGIGGTTEHFSYTTLSEFLDVVQATLARGLAKARDAHGLPISYFINEIAQHEVLAPEAAEHDTDDEALATYVRARKFRHKPVSAFLEGTVQALRTVGSAVDARALYEAVRGSLLFDAKLGMYRVNAPLDDMSFEIGRSKIFSPGWLENESIFLHMHYKFLLETLRSGLHAEFFADLQKGLVAFLDPTTYGRSPLENSSFIASSRFPDAKVHGVGFVARLSGATAEWISMVLHMGLGAAPFVVEAGELRFKPQPVLADWLFTSQASGGFTANSFGFKLFGHTWVVYTNPKRQNTFGTGAVSPVAFELTYADGTKQTYTGESLPEPLARDLRDGKLQSLVIALG